jgi:hypothetical protein
MLSGHPLKTCNPANDTRKHARRWQEDMLSRSTEGTSGDGAIARTN